MSSECRGKVAGFSPHNIETKEVVVVCARSFFSETQIEDSRGAYAGCEDRGGLGVGWSIIAYLVFRGERAGCLSALQLQLQLGSTSVLGLSDALVLSEQAWPW